MHKNITTKKNKTFCLLKKGTIIALMVLASANLKAQDKNSILENNLFKINILSPGVSYEKRLGENSTINSDLNLSLGFSYNSNSGSHLLTTAYLREQYRYYYNIEKRSLKNKNIKNNSANFVALSASYYLEPFGDSGYVSVYDGLTIAPVWGLQRTYETGINIALVTGAGYNFGTNQRTSGFVPVINFTLGWVLSKQGKSI